MSDVELSQSQNAIVQCLLSAAKEHGWKFYEASYTPGTMAVEFLFAAPDDPAPVAISVRPDPVKWAEAYNPTSILPAYVVVQAAVEEAHQAAIAGGFDPTVPRYAEPSQPSA